MDREEPSVVVAGVGLTMSEEGGLDEVVEYLRAVASRSRSDATSACSVPTWTASRLQLAQEVVAACSIPATLRRRCSHDSQRERPHPTYETASRFRNISSTAVATSATSAIAPTPTSPHASAFVIGPTTRNPFARSLIWATS